MKTLNIRPAARPGPTKTLIASRGTEGPDAIQTKIKASMVVPDLEGRGPSQPRNQYRPQHSTHPLPGPNKAPIASRGAEGPDAIQTKIKASIVVPDLEGCGPSQPRNQYRPQHSTHTLP